MTPEGARVSDRWPGPGGVVEESIVALADLVRTAADLIDTAEPRVASDLRVRATKHTVNGIQGLLRLTQ
jgi:arylsulfatase A-like enzyme